MSIHGHCITVTQCGTLFTSFTRIAQVLNFWSNLLS